MFFQKKNTQQESDALQRILIENNKVNILKEEKIPNVALETTQRQTKSMTHNHGEVRLQLDEENSLVSTDDEDETSETPTSSSYGSEDDGIDLENDSSDI